MQLQAKRPDCMLQLKIPSLYRTLVSFLTYMLNVQLNDFALGISFEYFQSMSKLFIQRDLIVKVNLEQFSLHVFSDKISMKRFHIHSSKVTNISM